MTTLALFLFLSITDPEAALMAFPVSRTFTLPCTGIVYRPFFNSCCSNSVRPSWSVTCTERAPGLGHPLDLQLCPSWAGVKLCCIQPSKY